MLSMQFIKKRSRLQSQVQSFKRKQLGITLLEILTVVSIIGIMAYAAAPQLGGMMAHKDLNSARSTLVQSLHKAKNIATTQSTIVEVSITDNIISIAPANGSSTETMQMPETIAAGDVNNFRFNSMGMATTTLDVNIDDDVTITIQPSTDETLTSTITITPTGLIAAGLIAKL